MTKITENKLALQPKTTHKVMSKMATHHHHNASQQPSDMTSYSVTEAANHKACCHIWSKLTAKIQGARFAGFHRYPKIRNQTTFVCFMSFPKIGFCIPE